MTLPDPPPVMFGFSSMDQKLQKLTWPASPSIRVPGDWTLVFRNRDGIPRGLLSSMYASFPVYYCDTSSSSPLVSDNVFALARDSNLQWDWNPRAIASLALFGSTLREDTIHPCIQRAPNATALGFGTDTADVRTVNSWAKQGPRSTIQEWLSALSESLVAAASKGPLVLSLSGGYDSRLLLAVCLQLGLRPRLITLGSKESTDYWAARQLGLIAGIPVERIELAPQTYLDHGSHIARLASGAKRASHWHTYLFAREIGLSKDDVLLNGLGGELVRMWFLDGLPRVQKYAARYLPGSAAVAWRLTVLQRRQRLFSNIPLIRGLSERQLLRMASSAHISGANLAMAVKNSVDQVQRRHLHGSSVALLSDLSKVWTPFTDEAVADVGWRLPSGALMGNKAHLEAIRHSFPRLLNVPFVGGDAARKGYHPFHQVRDLPEATEKIVNSPLEWLFDGIRSPQPSKWSTDEFELLLSLAYASDSIA